ncbi:MAG: serine hydrolase [Flavobacteriaceae bacterium]|nr:MAG: serine hydrolase [Flavobacteriaceae bacterium]
MKKIIKYGLLVLLIGLITAVYINYPRLNIISGYASKNMASSVFLAHRSEASILQFDNNFDPISKAEISVNALRKTASANSFGVLERTAVYREGLGAVLIDDDFDLSEPYLSPKRNLKRKQLPYPYGDLPQKDTLFSNVDYKKIENIVNAAFDTDEQRIKKTRAVLVIYKNQIIIEKYEKGIDKETPILGWSMTKSITSTIVGILVKQRKFDIYKPAPISAWKNDERSEITTHNLLQMNSGLEWVEDYNTISDVSKMLFLTRDMTISQRDKKLDFAPGTHWNYSSGTTNLLSRIIRNQFKTHQEYLDYWYTELIDKIGMHSMVVEADMAGNYIGSSYGWATTRDWAKFGLLYLYKGNWNGEQLFDANWETYVKTPAPNSEKSYGGHFWLNADKGYKDVPLTMYSCNGYQGQRVAIFPSKDLVIVRMGLASDGDFDFNALLGGVYGAIE